MTADNRLKMVGWYEPKQLIRTAGQVIISTIFGRHADHRLIEALTPASDRIFDRSCDEQGQPRSEIWVDYVADTGDGWNSTYAVAYWLTQPTLRVTYPQDQKQTEHTTKRGNILVFGGDEVYPTPSRQAYQQRLVQPYETALRQTQPPHPEVFAIPGNHDWYDSLVSFTRLFCSKQWFAGWVAPQSRSYFAIKLPHGWWLLGTDVQLGSDIDGPQVEYFKKAASQMQQGDRIVLCTAEPHWIYSKIYGAYDADVYSESNLEFLEKKILGRKVTVFLAGDLHHYRRHEADDHTQKITAGGGGAFLHPTHGPDVSSLKGGFKLKASFPDVRTSRRLCWRNLEFLILNRWFGSLTGMFYVLTAWAVMAPIATLGIRDIGQAITVTLRSALGSPASAFWGLALFVGFLVFTDTHSMWYRRIAGSLHGLVHVLAVFFIGWGAAYLCVSVWGLEFKGIPQLLISGTLIFAGGWIIGSLIMGFYLLISLNVFGRHSNEAFSSLAIQDWKNFLRLHIDAEGTLTILPIGIRRVPRKWRPSSASSIGQEILPDDPQTTDPELIEPSITLRR